jgi:hypothetical protein
MDFLFEAKLFVGRVKFAGEEVGFDESFDSGRIGGDLRDVSEGGEEVR